jgi:hypothetical protein
MRARDQAVLINAYAERLSDPRDTKAGLTSHFVSSLLLAKFETERRQLETTAQATTHLKLA